MIMGLISQIRIGEFGFPHGKKEVLIRSREIIFNAISLAAGFFGNFALLAELHEEDKVYCCVAGYHYHVVYCDGDRESLYILGERHA